MLLILRLHPHNKFKIRPLMTRICSYTTCIRNTFGLSQTVKGTRCSGCYNVHMQAIRKPFAIRNYDLILLPKNYKMQARIQKIFAGGGGGAPDTPPPLEFAKLNISEITGNEKISCFSYLCTSTVIRQTESIHKITIK